MDANLSADIQFFLRWIHFVAGIAWIGILYFFNFINGPFGKTMDGPTKQKVVPELMPRALWWFRWGAMFTFLSGVGILLLKYFIGEGALGFKGEGSLMGSPRGQWISLGATLGFIMWFNVWFIIWPLQQKIIPCVKKGEKPPELDKWMAKAALFSKINTYLSGPMLFGMAAGSGFLNHKMTDGVWGLVPFVVGFGLIYLLYNASAKVKPWKME